MVVEQEATCKMKLHFNELKNRQICVFKLTLLPFLCRVVENGVETVTVEEDGTLQLKTVNGEPQALQY